MKRIISTLLLVVVMLTTVLASFTGCNIIGGPKPGTGADFVMPEEGFNTEETITIKFYHSMGANLQEVLNDAIAEFNTLYPNIIIEHESYGDYNGVRDQIKTEIAVGGQPHNRLSPTRYATLYGTNMKSTDYNTCSIDSKLSTLHSTHKQTTTTPNVSFTPLRYVSKLVCHIAPCVQAKQRIDLSKSLELASTENAMSSLNVSPNVWT